MSSRFVEPIAYRLTNYAYLKLLVAAEEIEVREGEVSDVRIEPIILPPSTISSPLSAIRHAFGIVLDVHGLDGAERRLESVSFLPIEDGLVERGDLLGVIKVFILGKEPELRTVENQLLKRRIKIVYRTNGKIRRDETDISEMWYRRWHLAEWLPLIAEEEVGLEARKPRLVRISPIEIPANTIPVPLFIMRNAYGIVLDLHLQGRPKKIEENRTVSRVLFLPVFDGKVRRGDILGVFNIYNVSVGERFRSLMRYLLKSFRGNLVYWKDGEIRRREVDVRPLYFRRSSMGRLEPVFADEDMKLKANRLEVVKIEEMDFPACTIVQPLTGMDEYGTLLDVFSREPLRRVEDEKRVNRAVFLPYKDMKLSKGDLLGVINVYHVTVLYEPEAFILKHGGLFPVR